jgi:hypothetical protein
MPKNDSRKNEIRRLMTERGVSYTRAMRVLDSTNDELISNPFPAPVVFPVHPNADLSMSAHAIVAGVNGGFKRVFIGWPDDS